MTNERFEEMCFWIAREEQLLIGPILRFSWPSRTHGFLRAQSMAKELAKKEC